MIQFKEKSQTDGQKAGQTLFYRTLLTTARGPKTNIIIQAFIKAILLMSVFEQRLSF